MTKDEALKIALEALEGLINRTSGQSIYSFMETERRIAMSACVGIREALAQPEQTNIARHEANVQKFLNAPQSEQEPVAWRFTGIAGLKRYMTQKQYDAQTPEIKKWYEPFKCKNCTTPPQPEQEPVVQYIGVYTTPSQRKPLTDEQIDEEFKLYASKFDTSSDKWLDMGADDYFKAGFKAAHGIKEKNT